MTGIFRGPLFRAHGIPFYHWNGQYFGDLTGVESLLGKEKKANP